MGVGVDDGLGVGHGVDVGKSGAWLADVLVASTRAFAACEVVVGVAAAGVAHGLGGADPPLIEIKNIIINASIKSANSQPLSRNILRVRCDSLG